MFKRILIINPFGIGDVLFSTPLIRNLSAHIPDLFLGYLVNSRAAQVLKDNPKVNAIYIYDRDDFVSTYNKSKVEFLKRISGLLEQIKKDNFDLVLDLSLSSYASFFSWWIGIKERVGFDYKKRSPLLTKKVRLEGYEGQHVADHYLSLLGIINVPLQSREMEFVIKSEDRQWAERLFSAYDFTKQPNVVAFVPGGGMSWGKEAILKHWSPENYAKLADKLIENFFVQIILMGDKNDEAVCTQVVKSMKNPCLRLDGQTNLGQFGSLLAKCRVAVLNDGGPLHIAVASNAKTVSIFGSVDEKVYGPYPVGDHEVVKKGLACQPCYRGFRKAACEHISCLRTLTVDEVLEKVKIFLQ